MSLAFRRPLSDSGPVRLPVFCGATVVELAGLPALAELLETGVSPSVFPFSW
jgi:hypothetical protein